MERKMFEITKEYATIYFNRFYTSLSWGKCFNLGFGVNSNIFAIHLTFFSIWIAYNYRLK